MNSWETVASELAKKVERLTRQNTAMRLLLEECINLLPEGDCDREIEAIVTLLRDVEGESNG